MRALERTGDVRESAKDAGIDHSTAYARRKAHPEFAADWEAALGKHAAAKKRAQEEGLEALQTHPLFPHSRERSLSPSELGEDLVVSGGQARRAHKHRWTKAAELRFFATLAETANVKLAADAAGFSTTALYERRLRHPLFAEQWAAAVETARARLDLGAIELASQAITEMLAGTPAEAPKISISEALQILKLGADPRSPTGPGGKRRLNAGARANLQPATNQEIAEALTKRLVAFDKRIEREKARKRRRE